MTGLRAKFALTGILTAVAALVAVLVLVGPALRQRAAEQQERAQVAEAQLVAYVMGESLALTTDPRELDRVVDAIATRLGSRVTLVDTAGRVIADSSLTAEELDVVENHAERPEIVAALRSGVGSSIRRSTTVERDLLYTAVPVVHRGTTLGVARVATPLVAVDAQADALQRSIAAALALALLAAALFSLVFARSMTGPLRDTMAAARRFAAGDLSARVPAHRRDEVGELGSILNRALEQLQAWYAAGARDRARLNAVLATMEDGVIAVDSSGTVVLANDSVQRLLGWDPVGKTLVDAFRQREVSDLVSLVQDTGARQTLDELTWRRSERVLSLVAVPFPGATSESGVLLTLHDVTARRRLERVRRDFVANASHELRTPLTSIRGFVEALEDGALRDPERGRRFLAKIHSNADQMAALIDDLLQLSTLEGGATPPEIERVAVAEVVREILSSMEVAAGRRHIRLEQDVEGAPALLTDRGRLGRILASLVDNAIKYGNEGGVVVVSARAGEGQCVVEVADDGPGIAAEHLPRLFERFYRVDKARSRDQGGTGLGLSIVRHLAASLGGRVDVESRVGEGSTFRVVLPARREGVDLAE